MDRCVRFLVRLPVVLACLAAPSAHAEVTLVSQSRIVSTFAFLDPGPGWDALRSEELIESLEAGPFLEHAVCHVDSASSFVTTTADQESSIAAGAITSTFSISAEGRLVPPGLASLGIASTGLTQDFDLDAPTSCMISATVSATGDAVVDIEIRIRDGIEILRWQLFATEEEIEHEEVLSPGSYQLTVGAGGEGATGPGGTGTSFADVTFSLTFAHPASVEGGIASAPRRVLAYPSPASSTVMLELREGNDSPSALRVFDTAGSLVRTLTLPGGAPVEWDTRDAQGRPVPNGIYFVRRDGTAAADARVTILR